MKYNPHEYQIKAITHLIKNPTAVLFLDMGLGKTVITLSALRAFIITGLSKKILIIAPKRVAQTTWPEEIKKWDHTRELDYALLTGNKQNRTDNLHNPAPIHIINRENIPWLATETTKTWPYDTVVIDELSSFKSASTQRFKALHKKRPQIRRIIGLTGTPAPNGLIDLWAQYKLIDQGKTLGKTLTTYKNHWFHPTKYVYGRPVDYQPNPGAEKQIYKAIAPITLSMQQQDHLKLPNLTVLDYPCKLPPAAITQYRAMKQNMILNLENRELDAANAAVLAAKLQQIASGAIYTKPDNTQTTTIHNTKLNTLEDLIEQANNQPVLVVYWFKHEAQRIRQRFPQARPIKTPESIKAWNEHKIPIGLIHPASAGHGLNLQAGGHYLIWFTPIWNLEYYQQTNARLHRQGQTRPVTIIRIVATDTIDTRIIKRLETKDTNQNNLITALKKELEE